MTQYAVSLLVTVDLDETPYGPFYKASVEFQGALFEAHARRPGMATALVLDELSKGLKDATAIVDLLEVKNADPDS